MSNTLVALYNNIDLAQAVLRDLQEDGFAPERMSLVAQDARNMPLLSLSAQHHATHSSSSMGRDFGAMMGGLTGLLMGLVTIIVPGVGPVVAAGPLAALFGSAAGTVIGIGAGALTGGLSAALVQMNIPEDKANFLAQGVCQGYVLVMVEVTGTTVDRAIGILSHFHPNDIQYRIDFQPYSSNARKRLAEFDRYPDRDTTIYAVHELQSRNGSFDPNKTEPRRPRTQH